MIEISTPAQFVEAALCISAVLMGISHIVQPRMWEKFFGDLHAQGTTGVLIRTFALELWPALLIVVLHQVWSGPGLVVTLYGWLLFAKILISSLFPDAGLRALAMAQRGGYTFIVAGALLAGIGLFAGWALIA